MTNFPPSPPDPKANAGYSNSSDPGILFNLYYPVPTSYENPGPDVFKC